MESLKLEPSLNKKICLLRTQLEKLIVNGDINSDEVLKLSMKLDKYIKRCYNNVEEVKCFKDF